MGGGADTVGCNATLTTRTQAERRGASLRVQRLSGGSDSTQSDNINLTSNTRQSTVNTKISVSDQSQ